MTPVSLQPSGWVVGDGEVNGRVPDVDAQPLPDEVARHFQGYLVNWKPMSGTWSESDGEGAPNSTDEAANNEAGLQDDGLMDGLSESGINIGERELQLAAGAAYRGGDADTIKASYQRYVAALKGLKVNLNEDLHPLVDEAIKGIESLIELIDQNRTADEPGRLAMGKDILSQLDPGERVLLPAAVRGHAMVAELGRFKDGSFYLRIYNSGAGVQAHHLVEPGQGGKYSTFVEYRFDSIQAQDLAQLFNMSDQFGGTDDVNAVYDWAQTLPGSVKTPRAAGQYTYQSTQQSNDCALESIHSYLKDLAIRGFNHQAENPVAKALYLEMQAAYLNQLILDYNAQNGYTESVEHLLWGVRVRADRAELAAANAMGDAPKALFSQVKANTRLYNQFADLAADPHNVQDFPYLGNPIDLTYDPASWAVGKLVFTSQNGQVFTFDKTSRSLTIQNSGLGIEIQPRFDDNGKVLSFSVKMSLGTNVFLDETYLRVPSSDIANHPDLRGLLSPEELAQLGATQGDVYLKIQRSQESQVIEGYLYTSDGKQFIPFNKSASDESLSVLPATDLLRLSKGGRYRQIGSDGASSTDLKLDFSVPETPIESDPEPPDVDGLTISEDEWRGLEQRGKRDVSGQVALAAVDHLTAALRAQIPGLTDAELNELALDPDGGAVRITNTTSTVTGPDGTPKKVTKTQISQTRPDGTVRTLTRVQMEGAQAVWTRQDLSSDGLRLHEITRTVGSDGYSERTVERQTDGSLRETLLEKVDSQAAATDIDHVFVRTERTTVGQADGSSRVIEQVRRGDSLENVQQGGHPSHTEQKVMVRTLEVGPDGVERTREVGSTRILEGGRLTLVQSETVTAHSSSGDVVESLESTVTTPSKVTVRSRTQAGQVVEEVWVDGRFVPVTEVTPTPEINTALAAQDLARASNITQMASLYGVDYVAPLLGESELSTDPAQRETQLETLMEQKVSASMSRAYLSGAFMTGGAALALYSGITGIMSLNRAIQAGSAYGVAAASTGVAAAGAQVAEVALQGASLLSSSARALNALTRAAGVAGKLSVGLGLVATGMAVPGLIDAIQRHDTKAIVSSAVNLGGAVAALAAGAAIGGPLGMAIGLGIGLGVVAFTELWNWFYNPPKPITGPNPLTALSREERVRTLQNAQVLWAHWSELGGDLNTDRLKALAENSPNAEIKGAAQFFVDHANLIPWIDGSNGGGGDLEQRRASFDGTIGKADLARFMGYVGIPTELYETLPPPSEYARYWVAGILDAETHNQIIEPFGVDGFGGGSGDGLSSLPEYANIASGLFDEQTRALIQKAHPDENAEQIEQRLSRIKLACAYLAVNPSEFRYFDTAQYPDQEDGLIDAADLNTVRQAHQASIDEMLSLYPNGMPSFNEWADVNASLGLDNPGLWRPGRFGLPNPFRPQSTYQVALDHFSEIDVNHDDLIDWVEMARAREQAVLSRKYGLYYSLDHLMRHGGDVFAGRGEGLKVSLRRADLAAMAEAEAASFKPTPEPTPPKHPIPPETEDPSPVLELPHGDPADEEAFMAKY